MAFVVRAGRLVACRGLNNYLKQITPVRCISTSKKTGDTATVAEKLPSHSAPETVDSTAASIAKKKWSSYGYSYTDQEEDVASAHIIMFMGLTVAILFGSLIYFYSPDRTLKDWAHREAYLQLREREAKGLPLIDPNYVDPSKIELPSDEELKDKEIII